MTKNSNLPEIGHWGAVCKLLGFPPRKRKVFAQTLPSRLGDCVCLNHMGPCEHCNTNRNCSALGFSLKLADITTKTLERCKLYFPGDIKPENFFLVFSTEFRGLMDAQVYERDADEPGNKIANTFGRYSLKCGGAKVKGSTTPWAVVFCNVQDCQKLEQFGFCPQNVTTGICTYYMLSFQDFEKIAPNFTGAENLSDLECMRVAKAKLEVVK